MKFIIMGSGSSAGVPQVGCDCEVCNSTHPKNVRTRCSVLIQSDSGKNILIDPGPDLKQHLLANDIKRIDAIYITHIHADHIDGFNEIRPLTFDNKEPIKLYSRKEDLDVLRKRFDYIFNPDDSYPGAPPPLFEICDLPIYQELDICDVKLRPILLNHGNIDIAGVLIKNLAYAPDCSAIPKETEAYLQDIEHLVIDAIWPHRVIKHHFNIEQALDTAKRLNAKNIYLTHLSHYIDYEKSGDFLPSNACYCYDGMEFEL